MKRKRRPPHFHCMRSLSLVAAALPVPLLHSRALWCCKRCCREGQVLTRSRGAPKWNIPFFSTTNWYVVALTKKCLATDATLTIGKTPKYTVRKKGARHWSGEDACVTHCHSAPRCVIRSNTAGALCILGRMCHHVCTYSHREAHGTVVSTELNCCSCFCTHQTEKRQVGPQQDLAATCA